ncbi:hypothetical protein [Caballeronia sp. dw_19]|uniref:hypothetical protein n=1 Tax=Caballeronia sp. dw_19 TaxID=2719791 RepID=UPI001BD36325|nr:hypothetical protein [Caballeronia sp. dw_19]
MAAKKIPNAAARPAWTVELVAQRAKEFFRLKADRLAVGEKYKASCSRFRMRHFLDRIDIDDPAFHRATRKAYAALQKARAAERNALRRLETAVRNCPLCAHNEPSKAPEATLPVDFALVHEIANSIHFAPSPDAKRAIAHAVCTGLLGLLQKV